MRILLVILLLISPAFGQAVEKRTGDIILVTVNNVDPADSFLVYRKVGTDSPMLIGAIAAQPNVWTYTWATTMPAGRPKDRDYGFWVELKKNNLFAGKSNVALVKRIK